MKLRSIRLQNFRQFRDDTIDFADEPTQNVTVVHGSNGSGKTTLLNAFTWVLYDSVDFDTRPERLTTEGVMANAKPGEEIEVSVTLEFDHEGAAYSAKRWANFKKRADGDFDGQVQDSELVVTATEGGTTTTIENGRTALNQIIPERLSELFFFDGEDIDELAGVDNEDKIREAIENIMGLTILDRSIRHVDYVAGKFEDEYAEYGSEELNELIQEKKELENDIEQLERKKGDKSREQERVAEEISDIEQRLADVDDSSRLQEERSRQVKKRDQLQEEIDENTEAIREAARTTGYAPVAMPLIRETAEELDRLREQGVIPSNLTDDFLDELLESQQCICGRELPHDSPPYHQIASLRGEAPAEGVERAAIRVIGQLSQFTEDRDDFVEHLEHHVEERRRIQEEVDKVEQQIDDISTELGDMNETIEGGRSIQSWENERASKEQQKVEAAREEGQLEQKIEDKQEAIDKLEDDVGELREDRAEARTARRRQQAAEAVRDELTATYEKLRHRIRQLSDETIKETFSKVARKELEAEITDGFALKIYQDVADGRVEVEKSTGERQIASLAFIGSLVKIAQQRYEADGESEYFTGGIYPLVMDSPFGALDKEHRRGVSKILPTLATQVVVFATDSQWEGPVEEEMAPSVGKQYWLDFDAGTGSGNHPQTRIEREQKSVNL
jgi:DNA sulfur modification protein DndD